jgi:hypothetical protein
MMIVKDLAKAIEKWRSDDANGSESDTIIRIAEE